MVIYILYLNPNLLGLQFLLDIMSSLSVLTWNITGTDYSDQAPSTWDHETNMFHILDIIEDLDPDFICLQEMPKPTTVHYLSNSYANSKPVRSHAGYTACFVRKGSIAGLPIVLESKLDLGPASGIRLKIGDHHLTIFSLHLLPYADNHPARIAFITDLYQQVNSDQSLILAGDWNMREHETAAVLRLGLHDAYQRESDPDRSKYATWASTINRFHRDGPRFEARFDRIYYKGLHQLSYTLIGDQPLHRNHYLSDHFGILTTFDWS